MKQLHKQSGTRRDEEIPISQTPPYSPKALKHPRSLPRTISYLLKEQRLLFILVGILIGSTLFILQPSLSHLSSGTHLTARSNTFSGNRESITYYDRNEVLENYNAENKNNYKYHNGVGRVPVGIGRKRKRIVVTGGAGFVGSHLVDKLIARGDDVIVIDNFFTGRKENVVHLLGNPRFELIRHDVVEPILLEVDQIYHLACPASPVHYKYNPVKTIISLILWFL
ncbi:UDP-glucuronic acid decarboxylase 1 [Abeliophyllum distichum]|uniref:UDP-glucuronate decarboxylase n=1 Tax=Abeliophyllum distichum TaxID=126358 RepID=A0ABD1R1J7_9LAMI